MADAQTATHTTGDGTHGNGADPALDGPLPAAAARLAERLRDGTATIGVIGLGYVGLPLAVEFARRGFSTLGIDVVQDRVDDVNAGRNYIGDVEDEALAAAVAEGHLRAATSLPGAELATRDVEAGAPEDAPDVVFICVPTPVDLHKSPDTAHIEAAARMAAETIRSGQLVVLKSTTYPDTTEGLVQPILAAEAAPRGLQLGRDYFLAFSPERVDPGNAQFTTANTPVVVGGVTAVCTAVTALAMRQIVGHVHEVSSPRVAEMEKLLENIFRSVNIALVNELARLCDRMGGISVWEVVEAAATKPFGYMPFFPGPGLGGHCIPIDPYYLSWLARRYDFETSFITLSARTNEDMPFYVADAIVRALAGEGAALASARVLVLGVAFKRDVADTRHSPAARVLELLLSRGVGTVGYSDPYVDEYAVASADGQVRLRSEALTEEAVGSYDVVVLITDHTAFDYEMIARSAGCALDTRNGFGRRGIYETGSGAPIRLLGSGQW